MASIDQLNSFLNKQYKTAQRIEQESKQLLLNRWTHAGLNAYEVKDTIEQFCKDHSVLDESTFLESAETTLAPKLRDRLLDDEEERHVVALFRQQGWPNLSDAQLIKTIEEITESHSAFLARKLRPQFVRQIREGLSQNKSQAALRAEIAQWALDQSISDTDGIQELIDEAFKDPNSAPSSALAGGALLSAQSSSTGELLGSPLMGQAHQDRGSASGLNVGLNALNTPSSPSNQIQDSSTVASSASSTPDEAPPSTQGRDKRATKFIEGRIGNDLFLDLQEEQEYFAWVNDELEMGYDDADQLLNLVIEQRGATRERTAVQQFRVELAGMLDDQYLDAAEVNRAYQFGRSLGLERADEGFSFIEKIMQEEVSKAGALTELEAQRKLQELLPNLAKGKQISPENLEQTVKNVLNPYRLYHNEEAREQVQILAEECARSQGYMIGSGGQMSKLIAGLVGVVAIAGGVLMLPSDPPVSPSKMEHSTKNVAPQTLTEAPPSCALDADATQKLELWLKKAQINLENDQLLTPVENCMKRWIDLVNSELNTTCGEGANLSSFYPQLIELRRHGRDRYLKLAEKDVKSGSKKSACETWIARAEIFGGGEVVELFKQKYCQ
jgi:hypothetical protein